MKKIAFTFIIIAIVVHAAAAEHVTWTMQECLSCHRQSERAALAPRVTAPCSTLCLSCHELERHHKVGVAIESKLPVKLILTAERKNTCVTCHDTTAPRVDSNVWVAQSFIAKAIRRANEHRTYYLVTRNDRGQLCRNCH